MVWFESLPLRPVGAGRDLSQATYLLRTRRSRAASVAGIPTRVSQSEKRAKSARYLNSVRALITAAESSMNSTNSGSRGAAAS